MIRENFSSSKKIAKYLLLGAVIVGITVSLLRMLLAVLAMLGLPAVMGGSSAGLPSTEPISTFAPLIYMVSPYFIGGGIISTFLYVYLFPDQESRNVLIGWGVLMTLQLIASMYFAWL